MAGRQQNTGAPMNKTRGRALLKLVAKAKPPDVVDCAVLDSIPQLLRSDVPTKPSKMGDEVNRLGDVIRATRGRIPVETRELFFLLCLAFYYRWYFLLARKVWPAQEAHDLASEAGMKAVKRLRRGFPAWVRKSKEGQAAGYVYTCVKHAWLSALRPRRRAKPIIEYVDGDEQLELFGLSPGRPVLELNDAEAQVFVGRELSGGWTRRKQRVLTSDTTDDKARDLGLSKARVSVIEKQARAELRKRAGRDTHVSTKKRA